jgi:hypothetical protein
MSDKKRVQPSGTSLPNGMPATGYVGSCQYHKSILSGGGGSYNHGRGLDPIARYLAEGPNEQASLFIRPDSGQVSTAKNCTCMYTGINQVFGIQDTNTMSHTTAKRDISGASRR